MSCSVVSFTNLTRHVGDVKENMVQDNSQNMKQHFVKHAEKTLLPALLQLPYGINPPRSLFADTKLMTTRGRSPMCATNPPKCLPLGLPLEYPWM